MLIPVSKIKSIDSENLQVTVIENGQTFTTDATIAEINIMEALKKLPPKQAEELHYLIETFGQDQYSEGYDSADYDNDDTY